MTINCLNCKKDFLVENWRKNKAKYCSRLCQNRSIGVGRVFSEATKIKIGLANSGEKFKKECKFCGKELYVTKCHLDKVFCSQSCYGLNKQGARHPNWKGGLENKKVWTIKRRAMQRNAEGTHTLQ